MKRSSTFSFASLFNPSIEKEAVDALVSLVWGSIPTLTAPKGWVFTGEYRAPKIGEFYFTWGCEVVRKCTDLTINPNCLRPILVKNVVTVERVSFTPSVKNGVPEVRQIRHGEYYQYNGAMYLWYLQQPSVDCYPIYLRTVEQVEIPIE